MRPRKVTQRERERETAFSCPLRSHSPLVRARLTGREQPTPPRTLLISDRPRVDSLLVLSVLVGDPLEFEVKDGLVLDESFAGDERGLGVGVAQDQLREFKRRGL